MTIFISILILISNFYTDSKFLNNNIFEESEVLKYKISYKISEVYVHAGNVIFESNFKNIENKSFIKIKASGNTTPAFDIFYKVRDEYLTLIDTQENSPSFFVRNVNEGGFKIYNSYQFDNKLKKIKTYTFDTKNPEKKDTFDIEVNTQDVLSSIYYCRKIDYNKLKISDIISFPLFIDRELYEVGLEYIGKKYITTDYGEYDCIVLKPRLLKGRIFDKTDEMNIYITDDKYHIPVYIKSPLKVGEVVAILSKYKNK